MANWLKQSITGADNKTYEGAYLALLAIIVLVALTILVMLTLAGIEISLCDRKLQKECFNPAGLGGGIAAVLGGLAGFLGGVGAYILMDRKQDQAIASSTTTRTERETVTKVDAPVVPAVPTADAMVAAGRGIEPLSPKIGREDVGKSVAMVSPKRKPTKGRK